jgi:hypothetical protein
MKKNSIVVFFSGFSAFAFVWVSFLSATASAVGNANWMEDIYQSKPQTRLVDVAIPGTHNSGTYNISYLSPLEPGQPFFLNLVKPIVAGWSKTQYKSIYQQLMGGIRYLDIRIAFDRKKRPHVVHGLVSISFRKLLNEISRFVDHHPKEIVLFSYRLEDAYRMNKIKLEQEGALLQRLDGLVEEHFKEKLRAFSDSATFADFWEGGYSVMVVKRFQDLWPQSYSLGRVRTYLEGAIVNRNHNMFSNLQLIFTPPESMGVFVDPRYAFPMLPNENNLSVFTAPIREHGISWIKSWKAAGYRPNIVTTDFYDKFPFVRAVLDFNTN